MRNKKQIFYIVLILFVSMIVFTLLTNKGSTQSIILTSFIVLAAGIWILLRKRIFGEEKAISQSSVQPSVSSSGPTSISDGTQIKGLKRKNETWFAVEKNLEAIKWPQECSWCGGPVERLDTRRLKGKFKDVGQIQNEVAGIPYCKRCFGRSRWTGHLNNMVLILTIILGIALTLFVKLQEISGNSDTSTPWALAFIVCVAIGYGISWLLVKLPFKLALGKRLAEPVTASLTEDDKSDGTKGIIVNIFIPKKVYADKFAQENSVQTAT